MDELSTLGENTIAEFYQDRGFTVSRDEPEFFPLQPATLDDQGRRRGGNAATIRAILAGEDRGRGCRVAQRSPRAVRRG